MTSWIKENYLYEMQVTNEKWIQVIEIRSFSWIEVNNNLNSTFNIWEKIIISSFVQTEF